jgi:hypothetical protein
LCRKNKIIYTEEKIDHAKNKNTSGGRQAFLPDRNGKGKAGEGLCQPYSYLKVIEAEKEYEKVGSCGQNE